MVWQSNLRQPLLGYGSRGPGCAPELVWN